MTQPRLLGGRYELDGVVGRGGMAEVYRARDIRLDRLVAVKTLREDLARDQTFQARFRREAQSAASLNHPSIVAVYDTGEDAAGPTHVPYIVMEYVDGRTLRDLLRDDRRLLPERALEITDGVLRALDYSHRNGIVHRDIKPGNVMLTRSGDVKVMDFGIARAVSDAQATMTQTAQVIGTAQYLSPEQARGERVDARSDLYSTGCLLYELLTGRPPFLGDSPVAIAYQHVRENPVPPSRLDPEIPAWADAIVLKAMAKSPAERYQSANDMRNDIKRALSGMPVAAPTAMYGRTQRMGQATAMGGPTQAIPGYQYGPPEDTYGGRDDRGGRDGGRGRRTVLWWVLGALLVLAVLGGVAYAVLGGGGGKAVPIVTGDTLSQAQAAIAKAGLKSSVHFQPSDSVPKNHVIDTNPAGGNVVPAGSTVTIDVSSGPQKVSVPDVKGKSQAAATSQLQSAGFQVNVQTAQNSTAAPNTVVGQNPAPGTQVTKGSTVTIMVSPGGSKVPNVIGENVNLAQGQLQNAGFQVNIVYKQVTGVTDGTVLNQSPHSNGTYYPSGTVVTITVAQAASPTATPAPTASNTPTPTPSGTSISPPFPRDREVLSWRPARGPAGAVPQRATFGVSGGSTSRTATVARARSAAHQRPKPRSIGTGLRVRAAKPAIRVSAAATIAGPTRRLAVSAAARGSLPRARSDRYRDSHSTLNSVAKATTTPDSRIVIGVAWMCSRYSAPVAQPAATTVGRTASRASSGRRNAASRTASTTPRASRLSSTCARSSACRADAATTASPAG